VPDPLVDNTSRSHKAAKKGSIHPSERALQKLTI
jgi:hypothetical protein